MNFLNIVELFWEDKNQQSIFQLVFLPVDGVAVESVECLDGLGVSVGERRGKANAHQAGKQSLCSVGKWNEKNVKKHRIQLEKS